MPLYFHIQKEGQTLDHEGFDNSILSEPRIIDKKGFGWRLIRSVFRFCFELASGQSLEQAEIPIYIRHAFYTEELIVKNIECARKKKKAVKLN